MSTTALYIPLAVVLLNNILQSDLVVNFVHGLVSNDNLNTTRRFIMTIVHTVVLFVLVFLGALPFLSKVPKTVNNVVKSVSKSVK